MKIFEAIGNTPLVELKNGILAKLEMLNPTGSIKDRTAYSMLKGAMEKDLIGDKGIVEPTSGNTGISLAFLGAYYGIRVTIVMPENMSKQRINIMRSFGAKVILTPAEKGMRGALEMAEKLTREGYYMPDQFKNPLNPEIHYKTTAPEIWKQSKGRVDVFVCGIGTGGTFSGVVSYLKKMNPHLIAVAVEPEKSAVLSGRKAGIHAIQGIGAGFIPDVLDVKLIDDIITVADEQAIEYNKRLIGHEGVFAGISSGAAYYAATTLKRRYPSKTVLTIFADSMDRYVEGT